MEIKTFYGFNTYDNEEQQHDNIAALNLKANSNDNMNNNLQL